ncbi:uncharacterized protein LOC112640593 [Canis lupus dingo]|uniref:uncharacterized protein LOC112640593 n=1 Tax=Canis lupus dingo TaxID=286419 RepID=UPI000DC6C037|nr:uncharacterized protein LOC112640593 [Canis lupus dingo]
MVGSAGGIVAHTASRCSWGGIPTLSPQRTWPGSLFWSAGLEGAPSHCCTGDQMDGQILAHLGNPRTGALTYKVPWDPLAGLKPKPGGFPGDPGGPSVPSGGSCLQGHGGPMGEARGGVVWGPLLFWGGWPPSSPWWTDGGHQDSVRSKLLARHLSPGRKLQLTYVRVSARSLTTQPWPGSSLGPVDHWPHPADACLEPLCPPALSPSLGPQPVSPLMLGESPPCPRGLDPRRSTGLGATGNSPEVLNRWCAHQLRNMQLAPGGPGTRGWWGRRAQTPAPRWPAFCLWTVPPGHLDVDVDREARGGRGAPDSARDPRGSLPAGKQDPCQLSFMGTIGH